MRQNLVYFKATKDSIIVMMDKSSDFEDIKQALCEKVKQARKFFADSSSSIIFKGRKLNEEQEAELIEIISRETDLSISAVAANDDIREEKISRVSDKVVRMEEVLSATKLKADNKTADTVFHKGNLRSGMSIEHSGSVVVLGDVNPGGEIVAGGNIVVLGALKGLAHAGAFGNTDSFVAAVSLRATQLRISNIIITLAEELSKSNKSGYASTPSYAFIQEGKIYIAPLV